MPRPFHLLFVTVAFTSLVSVALFSDEEIIRTFRGREIGPTTMGGRVVDIEVDSKNVHRIFVASASGGLWATENNGSTWKNIFEDEKTISIGDIALDSKAPKTIWVGTGEANNQRSSFWGDGVYKTTDGGKNWINTGLNETHHIGRIVIDPNDSNIVYVAALGHLYTSNEERGLFKTTNGGKTWDKVLYVNDSVGVVDVVIDPSNPKILYAASYERIRRSWDFDGAGPGSAIYKTEDAGHTWKKLTDGLPGGEIGRIGLAIYQKNPKIVFATVSNQNLVTRSDTPRSRNRGGDDDPSEQKENKDETDSNDKKTKDVAKGEQASKDIETPFGFRLKVENGTLTITGLRRTNALARSGIANDQVVTSFGGINLDAKSPNALGAVKSLLGSLKQSDSVLMETKRGDQTISARLSIPSSQQPQQTQVGGEVYRSDDSGVTWKKVNRQPVGGSPAYYYGQIRIDPTDEKRLYMLSVPMYTSVDGGKNWSSVARSVHVDHHAIWVDPNSPNHLMLGNDGGFHQSYDYGKTWDHYFNIPMAQFYAVTADMQKPYHVYGGLQDNGSWGGPSRSGRSGIGYSDWYRVGGGDGFYVQVDPRDSDVLLSESQFGAISKTNRSTGARASIRPRSSNSNERYRFNWNSPILMSVHNPNVVYFGGNKLFKSTTQGGDWAEISEDLTTADPDRLKGNVPHCTITTIAESSIDKQLLMVGTDDGKVQVTTNGGGAWQDLSMNFPFAPKDWWCSRVVLSSHDTSTAFATFTGFREDDFRAFVFKTTDLGKTWTSIIGNLPSEPINVIQEDKINKELLYLGTEFGAYVTLDGGSTWSPIGRLPRVSVQDLLVHSREQDLIIGTHGRGIFIVDDISPLQQMGNKNDGSVHLYTPRTATIYAPISSSSFSGDRKFNGPNPSSSAKVWYRVTNELKDEYQIRIVDISGKELVKMETEQKPGLYSVSVPVGRPSSNFSRGGSRRSGNNRPPTVLSAGQYRVELISKDEKEKQSVVLKVEAAE